MNGINGMINQKLFVIQVSMEIVVIDNQSSLQIVRDAIRINFFF